MFLAPVITYHKYVGSAQLTRQVSIPPMQAYVWLTAATSGLRQRIRLPGAYTLAPWSRNRSRGGYSRTFTLIPVKTAAAIMLRIHQVCFSYRFQSVFLPSKRSTAETLLCTTLSQA